MAETEYLPATLIPLSMVPAIGEFVCYFGATDAELNRLIWHVIGVEPDAGREITADSPYQVRAALLERLAPVRIKDDKDRGKIIKLAQRFMDVASYRHRLLHDESYYLSPSTDTFGVLRAKTKTFTEFSEKTLSDKTTLCIRLMSRMQQYQIRNPAWNDDAQFP